MLSEALLVKALEMAVTVAAAYGGVKTSLNGARKDIGDIKHDVAEIKEKQSDFHARVSVLEDRSDRPAA